VLQRLTGSIAGVRGSQGHPRLGSPLIRTLNGVSRTRSHRGISAARHTLAGLPADLAPREQQPYTGPAIAIDWTGRPSYGITPNHHIGQLGWLKLTMPPHRSASPATTASPTGTVFTSGDYLRFLAANGYTLAPVEEVITGTRTAAKTYDTYLRDQENPAPDEQ